MKKQKTTSSVKTFIKFLRYLKVYRLHFALSLLFTAVSVALTLYVPVLVGQAIDAAVGVDKVDFHRIQTILITILVSVLITALLTWLTNVLNNRMTYGIVQNIRREAFAKIQRFPVSYIDSHSTGEIVSRMTTDVDQFSDGLLMGFTQFFTGIVTILGTLIFMLTISPSITAIVVIVTPASLFVAAFIAKRTYSLFKRQSEIRGEQTSLIDEMIGSHKTVAAFGQEKEVQERFDKINTDLQGASLRAIFYSSITNPVTRFLNSTVYALVALFGALTCISTGGAALSVGMLSSFLAYSTQYTKPFNEISGVVTELQNALACAERVFELIEEPIPEDLSDSAPTDIKVAGRIDFADVSFSYSKDRPLIKHLDLSVTPGQKVAIVGPTGCGKTTLINLLMRFYDVDAGSISLDGQNIKDINKSALRSSFGMVLQDTWLSEGTIRDNIAFGKPNATDEEIIAAAKAAHAHSFIRRLPKGYDTVIGESGGALSQGQKQLLCISRVMLSLPEMLILDEATSSIDTRIEIRIQKAFAAMMEGRTSFIVAHRLSTIKGSDLILVMKDGNVIEKGTHEELLEKRGFYFDLYNSQFSHIDS
ncbi:MAG: ABC transporter ATP-binding protein [Ruminococcaceae bacterium]|nr:ABC transporter ATP-binding protein [Oscillospiraceae bacterium]